MLSRSPGLVQLGSRFLNINRSGWRVWTTASQVVSFEPEQRFALQIRDNLTVWSLHLHEVAPGRTLLVQRRECPDGVTERSLRRQRWFISGIPQFQETLRAGMRTTLQKIKDHAER